MYLKIVLKLVLGVLPPVLLILFGVAATYILVVIIIKGKLMLYEPNNLILFSEIALLSLVTVLGLYSLVKFFKIQKHRTH